MTNRPRQEAPSPYPWPASGFEVSDLVDLVDVDDSEETNEIRHPSRNKLDREERRRIRSKYYKQMGVSSASYCGQRLRFRFPISFLDCFFFSFK